LLQQTQPQRNNTDSHSTDGIQRGVTPALP
jgi:hypothetical protein